MTWKFLVMLRLILSCLLAETPHKEEIHITLLPFTTECDAPSFTVSPRKTESLVGFEVPFLQKSKGQTRRQSLKEMAASPQGDDVPRVEFQQSTTYTRPVNRFPSLDIELE